MERCAGAWCLRISPCTFKMSALLFALGALVHGATCATEYIDYRVDLTKQNLRLYHRGTDRQPLADFESLQRHVANRGEKLVFATNAGIFMEDLRALGLYIEEGVTTRKLVTKAQGYGNFYLQPNGVFLLGNEGAMIVETSDYLKIPASSVRYANQSGPILLVKGEIPPSIATLKGMLPRNAVCVIDAKSVLLSFTGNSVTLSDFASHLKANGCKDALSLDGAISDVYFPAVGRTEKSGPFGPMFGVSERVLKQ